jgi:hypothetical protein
MPPVIRKVATVLEMIKVVVLEHRSALHAWRDTRHIEGTGLRTP